MRSIIWRLSLLALTVLATAGCATRPDGPTLGAASLGPSPAGSARIVLIREDNFVMKLRGFPVTVDGEPAIDLSNASYLAFARPAGHHRLSVQLFDFPGVTVHELDAVAGRTYYLIVRLNDNGNSVMAGAMFGLAGYAITAAAAASNNRGPVDFIPVDEATARRTFAALGPSG
jgi:hypothetical protein